jgi:Zn-dependent protease with chaperone function
MVILAPLAMIVQRCQAAREYAADLGARAPAGVRMRLALAFARISNAAGASRTTAEGAGDRASVHRQPAHSPGWISSSPPILD